MPIRTLDKKQRKAEGNCKANARASLLADQGKTFAMGLQQGHRMEKTQMFLPRAGQTEEEMEGRQAESLKGSTISLISFTSLPIRQEIPMGF